MQQTNKHNAVSTKIRGYAERVSDRTNVNKHLITGLNNIRAIKLLSARWWSGNCIMVNARTETVLL